MHDCYGRVYYVARAPEANAVQLFPCRVRNAAVITGASLRGELCESVVALTLALRIAANILRNSNARSFADRASRRRVDPSSRDDIS
jgi:hypothetical protein